MAEFDVWLQTYIRGWIPYLALTYIFLRVYRRYGSDMYKTIMAYLIDSTGMSYSRKMRRQKTQLFAEMHDMAARCEADNRLSVVEIGVGSGTNFAFYPENINLKCVDTNSHFDSYLQTKRVQYPNINFEFCPGSGDDLREIKTGSVDAVVATLLFCSVRNVDACLSEIKRILKPGGKFFYMEHVSADEGSWTHRIQRFVGVPWLYLFECNLTSKPWINLENAGFSKVQFERIYVRYPLHYRIISPQLIGTATK